MNTQKPKGAPKPKRQRAIAGSGDGIGFHRYSLYVAAHDRIKQAIADGYYLEAITLIESILSDRLESRTSFLKKQNQGFKTLGDLLGILVEKETVPEFRELLPVINDWRDRRNKALHELVKFEHGDFRPWPEKIAGLSLIAAQGLDVLRSFDKLDKRERRRNGARPAATEPNALE